MEEKRILVVDDDSRIAQMYAKAFTKKGYIVTIASNANEALEILPVKSHMVMFLDLHMPNMNGLELCRKIKEEWPMAICFAVTGYASLYELNDCREAGFEDYFTKPAVLSELIEAAESAFKKIDRWKKRDHLCSPENGSSD
jgi:CheY-like chemotaxis protein